MKVQVAQKHIDGGDHSCESCMVALALADAGLGHPSVGITSVSFVQNGRYRTGWFPESVASKIRDFMSERKVEPFEFNTEDIEFLL